MVTRTQSRSSDRSQSGRGGTGENRSGFSWGEGAAPMIAAAIGGAAIGIAANYGRKFITQAVSGVTGDWDEILTTEHKRTLAVIDKMLATDTRQTWKRSTMARQRTDMLDKHANE